MSAATSPTNILIRDETEADITAISEVTAAAFAQMEISNQTEHFIVEALRAAALTPPSAPPADRPRRRGGRGRGSPPRRRGRAAG